MGADARESGELQGKLVLDAWRADRETLDRSGDGILQYVMLEGSRGTRTPCCGRSTASGP